MKKTLIAAAVAAAVAAPAANAGVVIYGTIHASIDYLDAQTSSVCSGVSGSSTPGGGFNVCERTSKLGFKGSEDLGNGLKAIWKMETEIAISDGASKGPFKSARNAYIGLAGDWGTFLYGRHDTPYKMAYYASGIDMLGDSFMDTNALYGHQEWRRDDAIAYVSPNWNGLTIAAAIIPAEGASSDGGSLNDGLADSYSLGLMYSNNGLKLSAGYEDTQGEVGADSSNWMVGAGWSGNAFDISAVYVDQEVDPTFDITSYAVSLAYTMGNNKLIGTVGQSDWDTDDGLGYGVAVQHMLSKRTSAYLGYSSTEMLNAHRTQTGSTDFRGTDSEAVSFGMIHKF
ncbi:MAG: porin [Gammaproteobacteria bacterium]